MIKLTPIEMILPALLACLGPGVFSVGFRLIGHDDKNRGDVQVKVLTTLTKCLLAFLVILISRGSSQLLGHIRGKSHPVTKHAS